MVILKFYTLFVLIYFIVVLSWSTTNGFPDNVIDHMLHEHHYENRVRPLFYDRIPLHVSTHFTVIAADDINVNTMDLTLEIKISMVWLDERLKHNHTGELLLGSAYTHKVWIPDIYIVNAKQVSGHYTTGKNEIIRIANNGTVEFSKRLGIKASCHVNLRMFPWDTQICSLIIQSYTSDATDLIFSWYNDGEKGASFVQRLKERPMAQYDLNGFVLNADFLTNFQDITDKNLWSSLEASFSFRRLNGFYLIQILAPSNFLVILSWVSFLINPDHAPARVFLGTSCVLTMASIQNYINLSLPKVSYVKIIDVYSLSCYFFVVLVMAEYALVLLLNDRVRKEKIFKEEKKIPTIGNKRIQEMSPFCKFWPQLRLCIHGNPFCMHIPTNAGRVVDKTCILLFPIVFIIFNIAFWIYIQKSTGEEHIPSADQFFI